MGGNILSKFKLLSFKGLGAGVFKNSLLKTRTQLIDKRIMTCFVDQPWHHQIEKQSKKLSYISRSTSQTFIHQYRNQGTSFKILNCTRSFCSVN